MMIRAIFRTAMAASAMALCLLLGACVATRSSEPAKYAREEAIPSSIAVLAPEFEALADAQQRPQGQLDAQEAANAPAPALSGSDEEFIARITRGAIHNQLAGKGYTVMRLQAVDSALLATDWRALDDAGLCRLLEVDGVVRVSIGRAQMVKTAAIDNFEIEAQVSLINRKGDVAGRWRDAASRRKLSIPTSLIGLAGLVVEGLVSDTARQQMRLVVYDWAWKIAQIAPDAPQGTSLPEILSVETNVDKGLFGEGEKIEVRVVGEKDLKCSYDIGEFRRNIPLAPVAEGEYRGVFIVHEGDQARREVLAIRMTRPNGVQRLWIEPGGEVDIDGVGPAAPQSVEGAADREGVHLRWAVGAGDDLAGFVVERGDDPVGDYTRLGELGRTEFNDPEVEQGLAYYYRVRAVDRAGNLSAPGKPLGVVVPRFELLELSGELAGTLVAGNYLVSGPCRVPAGAVLRMMPGAKVRWAPGAEMSVAGELACAGTAESPVLLKGAEWGGIRAVDGSRLAMENVAMDGCTDCLRLDGGSARIEGLSLSGSGGIGGAVAGHAFCDMAELRIEGFDVGLLLDGGKSSLERSTLTGNTAGLVHAGGEAEINHNNIFGNGIDVVAESAVGLRANYLGTPNRNEMELTGPVTVKSCLDGPYPYGREVMLISDDPLTPAERDKEFSAARDEGILAFESRRYGDARQAFVKALALKTDRDCTLYFAYTLLALGEVSELERVLGRGIEVFPYEVRLYHVYVRHLAGRERYDEALEVLHKGQVLAPGDEALQRLGEYLEMQSEVQ